MTTQRRWVWLVMLGALSGIGCGSLQQLADQLENAAGTTGSEWTVSGSVGNSSNANVAKAVATEEVGEEAEVAASEVVDAEAASEEETSGVGEACFADTVIATDSSAGTVRAAVDSSCGFSMTLPSGESYVISFSKDSEFVGTLVFDSGIDGLTTSTLPLVAGSGELDLGTITVSGEVASPSLEPLDRIDQDLDGIMDGEDPDDDGDNIPDEEELDCDFDGILDDYDSAHSDCAAHDAERAAWVVAMRPQHEQERVSTYRTVKALLSCRVDPDTMDPDSFRVFADEHEVECEYDVGHWRRRAHRYRNHHRGIARHARPLNIIKCRHFEDPFETDTLYTVELDGLECLDGREVEPASMHFVTRVDRDEGEDAEELEYDQYEDSLEPEDEELTEEELDAAAAEALAETEAEGEEAYDEDADYEDDEDELDDEEDEDELDDEDDYEDGDEDELAEEETAV